MYKFWYKLQHAQRVPILHKAATNFIPNKIPILHSRNQFSRIWIFCQIRENKCTAIINGFTVFDFVLWLITNTALSIVETIFVLILLYP